MSSAGKTIVTVFGSADPREGDQTYELARATGRALAELGFSVANGGYGGTMTASARGAREGGGETIGVVCSIWKSAPNAWIDRVIRTHSLAERLRTLIDLGGGGYVVLPGATGTLVELAMVWELACKGMTERRPIVCMGGFWQPVIDTMASARPQSEGFVTTAASPEELARFFPPTRA